MPALVDYPHVVKEALSHFGDLFANEPQRQQITGTVRTILNPKWNLVDPKQKRK